MVIVPWSLVISVDTMFHKFCQCAFFILFKVFFRLEVKGVRNIPRAKAVIVASNHMSNFDPVVVGSAFPRNLRYMAKEELFRNKLFGALLRLVGAFPLKRDLTDVGSMKECLRHLREGRSVLVFPQGTRSVHPLSAVHRGVGFIAAKSNLPVIPTRVFGTETILPRHAAFFKGGGLKVVFGRPLAFESNDDYRNFSRRVMEEIFNLY